MRRLSVALLLVGLDAGAAEAQEFVEFPETNPEIVGGIAALQRGIAYPESERRSGIQGRVIVQVDVGPGGAVSNVQVVRSVSPGLDSAAVQAVRAARFTEARHDGRVVRTRLTLPITFRIDPGAAPSKPPVQVGRAWEAAFEALADSGAVSGGRGTVRLRGDDTERSRVTVTDDVVTEIATTAAAGSPGERRFREMRTRLGRATPARDDGFFHAFDLVSAGMPVAFDIAVDASGRTLRERLPRCPDLDRFPTCEVFPVPLGGFGGILNRAGLVGRRRAPPGTRVILSVEVDRAGAVTGVETVMALAAQGRVPSAVTEALTRAARETTFVMGQRADAMGPDDRLTVVLPTFAP